MIIVIVKFNVKCAVAVDRKGLLSISALTIYIYMNTNPVMPVWII